MPTNAVSFLVYLVICCWLVTRIPFFKQSGLQSRWLILFFCIKVLAGVAYAAFYLQPAYYELSDTWRYYHLSISETNWLLADPWGFCKDLFLHGYQESGNLFSGHNSYWNDLKSNLIIKLMAICNVLTFSNYYGDLVIFNFLFFFGPVALYRVARALLNTEVVLSVIAIFLVPSFLFWCSGLHKDGLIFLGLAMIMYHVHKQMQQHAINILSLFIVLSFFILLFALRNFMALLLVPALVVWLLGTKYNNPGRIAAVVYGTCIVVFFTAGFVHPALNLTGYIIEKQNEFRQLPGGSAILLPALENSIGGFIRFLPYAIDIACFRPHITEIKNPGYIPSVAEIILFWVLGFAAVFRKPTVLATPQQKAFLVFCCCFAVSFLLLAGYTITFSGAIVRYRAVVLPLLALLLALPFNSVALPFTGKGNKIRE